MSGIPFFRLFLNIDTQITQKDKKSQKGQKNGLGYIF
jgi:predicted nucleic acid-binding protein